MCQCPVLLFFCWCSLEGRGYINVSSPPRWLALPALPRARMQECWYTAVALIVAIIPYVAYAVIGHVGNAGDSATESVSLIMNETAHRRRADIERVTAVW
ncbi:unnamed protein product [Clonostachys rosea f. rosea IK726]|uniref:Uncharacterized protein n=1 Tax=Clonostachys rosea f. rosea IK726 TaxID=1349383 RepID=A0ACA9UGL8_BIOOC|nr:unnamed protein product [Clonostachys rosea f. rosea IK726]